MYKYKVDQDDLDAVNHIAQNWADLMESADRKNQHVEKIKDVYSKITMSHVDEFKKELREYYEEYIEFGPGADSVDLDSGLTKLEEAKARCDAFSQKKEEMVLSETLFGLPISQFDELINMESCNAQYSTIYEIYRNYRERRNEWAVITWQRLEYESLESGAKEFQGIIRKLEKGLKDKKEELEKLEKMPPFIKLK